MLWKNRFQIYFEAVFFVILSCPEIMIHKKKSL